MLLLRRIEARFCRHTHTRLLLLFLLLLLLFLLLLLLFLLLIFLSKLDARAVDEERVFGVLYRCRGVQHARLFSLYLCFYECG